jgi:hypothetical protein
MRFLTNFKVLTKWFPQLNSTSISLSFLYLFKAIFNSDGSDKHEGKVIGLKMFYQIMIRSNPIEFIHSIAFIYQDVFILFHSSFSLQKLENHWTIFFGFCHKFGLSILHWHWKDGVKLCAKN